MARSRGAKRGAAQLRRADPSSVTEDLDHAACVLKAMAHPTRLMIICGLLQHPSTLTEICGVLPFPQSTLAQHLAVLRRAGIIRGVRKARDVRFSVVDDSARQIMHLLCARTTAASWSDLAVCADTEESTA